MENLSLREASGRSKNAVAGFIPLWSILSIQPIDSKDRFIVTYRGPARSTEGRAIPGQTWRLGLEPGPA